MTSRGLTSILRVHKKGPSVGLARTGQPRGHKSRDEPSHQRTPSSTRGVHALQAGRAKHHPRSPSRSEGARRGGKSRPRASGPENQAGRGATARRPDARGQPRPAQAEAAPRQAGRRPQSQSTKPTESREPEHTRATGRPHHRHRKESAQGAPRGNRHGGGRASARELRRAVMAVGRSAQAKATPELIDPVPHLPQPARKSAPEARPRGD